MLTIKISQDSKLSKRLVHLVQDAVIKGVEAHYQKYESIAVSDREGKVKIVPAHKIPALLEVLTSKETAQN